MGFVTGFSSTFRRVAGSTSLATIDAVKAAPPPSPLRPVDLTSPDEINAVLDLATRIGDVLLSSGMSNGDVRAHMHAITEAYGIYDTHVDITLNTIMLYTTVGPTSGPLSAFRVVGKLSMDFSRLEEIDVLIRQILLGKMPRDKAATELRGIVKAPPAYNSIFVLLMWGVFTSAVAFMIGGGLIAAGVSFVTAVMIISGSSFLASRGLPLFFQNVYGGFVATVPATIAYEVTKDSPAAVNPSLIIAAGIVAMLAGLTLVQALQDGITGAPVTASARFFEAALSTGAIIAGIGIGLTTITGLGIDIPSFDSNPSPTITRNVVVTVSGALAGTFFAVACYARLRSTAVTTLTTLLGAAIYYMVFLPIGFGPVVSSGLAATLIGLAGGLLSRRYMIPPLITAVSGITPMLPGLALYRGMYAILNDRSSLGFSYLATAFATATALAAGVVLGEWIARRLRRPRIMTAYQGVRKSIQRPRTVAPKKVHPKKRVKSQKATKAYRGRWRTRPNKTQWRRR